MQSEQIESSDHVYAPTVPVELPADTPSASYVDGFLDGIIDKLRAEVHDLEEKIGPIQDALIAFEQAQYEWGNLQ
jgi:hypothetical protein